MKDKLVGQIMIIGFMIGALLVFNLVPYFAMNIEYESYNTLEFLSLVIINPIYLTICGIIYGMKKPFSWFLPAILACCFIPTVFLFFEVANLFYILIYAIFLVASQLFGISLKGNPKNII